jgi:hypothetical protein
LASEGNQFKMIDSGFKSFRFVIRVQRNSEKFKVVNLSFETEPVQRLKALKGIYGELNQLLSNVKELRKEAQNLKKAQNFEVVQNPKNFNLEEESKTFFAEIHENSVKLFRLKGRNGFLKPTLYSPSKVDQMINSPDYERIEMGSLNIPLNFDLPDQQVFQDQSD